MVIFGIFMRHMLIKLVYLRLLLFININFLFKTYARETKLELDNSV